MRCLEKEKEMLEFKAVSNKKYHQTTTWAVLLGRWRYRSFYVKGKVFCEISKFSFLYDASVKFSN